MTRENTAPSLNDRWYFVRWWFERFLRFMSEVPFINFYRFVGQTTKPVNESSPFTCVTTRTWRRKMWFKEGEITMRRHGYSDGLIRWKIMLL